MIDGWKTHGNRSRISWRKQLQREVGSAIYEGRWSRDAYRRLFEALGYRTKREGHKKIDEMSAISEARHPVGHLRHSWNKQLQKQCEERLGLLWTETAGVAQNRDAWRCCIETIGSDPNRSRNLKNYYLWLIAMWLFFNYLGIFLSFQHGFQMVEYFCVEYVLPVMFVSQAAGGDPLQGH